MQPDVQVPAPLLLDGRLTNSAKLLWMILRLGAPDQVPPGEPSRIPWGVRAQISPGLLQDRSGLSRDTVSRGLARLESAGWLSTIPKGGHTAPPGTASLPRDLLLDRHVGVQAKLLYGLLQLTPGFRDATGQSTYSNLSDLSSLGLRPVRAAVRELQEQGWLQTSQRTKFSPIHFTLRNPPAELREGDVAMAGRRIEEAPYLGEALMREYLSLIVDSDEFEDNATPGFLVNPYTDEELQLDRYYPPRVAFEFNGPQHYGPTALYAKEADIRKQQVRDLIKAGICGRRSITLVVIHPKDLCLEAMRRKVTGLLPMRNLDGHQPLVDYLEDVARSYRRKARPSRHADL